jgi:hypothetical protein
VHRIQRALHSAAVSTSHDHVMTAVHWLNQGTAVHDTFSCTPEIVLVYEEE